MARPKGMRKVDGIWIMPDGTVAPSSKSKVNNVKGYSDTAPVISNAPGVSHSATGPSENATPEISSGTGRLEVQEVATGTIVGGKVQGMHLYAMEEIKSVETQTGLTFAGNFASGSGMDLIPVFLRADHDDEVRRAKMVWIRKGF